MQKRKGLPKDSPYLDQKYDAAFVKTLMSDDDDIVDEETGNTLLTLRTKPPVYRSNEASILETLQKK